MRGMESFLLNIEFLFRGDKKVLEIMVVAGQNCECN